MTLSKKDLKLLGELIDSKINEKLGDSKKADVEIEGKPKDVIPSKERPHVIEKLTIKERIDVWGEINKDNPLKNKFPAARNLYKLKNIDGNPNITYTECFQQFLVPIGKHKKFTKKQMSALKGKVVKDLTKKLEEADHPQKEMWLEKALKEVQGE